MFSSEIKGRSFFDWPLTASRLSGAFGRGDDLARHQWPGSHRHGIQQGGIEAQGLGAFLNGLPINCYQKKRSNDNISKHFDQWGNEIRGIYPAIPSASPVLRCAFVSSPHTWPRALHILPDRDSPPAPRCFVTMDNPAATTTKSKIFLSKNQRSNHCLPIWFPLWIFSTSKRAWKIMIKN